MSGQIKTINPISPELDVLGVDLRIYNSSELKVAGSWAS